MTQVYQRVTVYFSGRVQGVGFRYSARAIGQDLAVSGYVQNLEDGRVLLVAEGSEADLRLLIEKITSKMRDYVRDVQSDWSQGSGEFGPPMLDSFSVRY